MVLDDIRVALADERAKIGDELSFLGGNQDFQDGGPALHIADSDEEDAALLGIESGRFEVKLEPMAIDVGQTAKADPARRHEALRDRADAIVSLAQVGQLHGAAQASHTARIVRARLWPAAALSR